MHPESTALLTALFVVLPLAVAALTAWGVIAADRTTPRRGRWIGLTLLATAGQLLVPAGLAGSGILKNFDVMPPPFMIMMALVFVLATWFAFSGVGEAIVERYGFAALIGLQAFRLPLELAMHHAADAGVMPSIMSYSGRNFDIVTGAFALLLLPFLLRGSIPRWLLWAFNIVGLGLLLNVLVIAIRATPLFAHFGPDQINTWVAYLPFVWLPTVLVPAAWAGHWLIFRKLLQSETVA